MTEPADSPGYYEAPLSDPPSSSLFRSRFLGAPLFLHSRNFPFSSSLSLFLFLHLLSFVNRAPNSRYPVEHRIRRIVELSGSIGCACFDPASIQRAHLRPLSAVSLTEIKPGHARSILIPSVPGRLLTDNSLNTRIFRLWSRLHFIFFHHLIIRR